MRSNAGWILLPCKYSTKTAYYIPTKIESQNIIWTAAVKMLYLWPRMSPN